MQARNIVILGLGRTGASVAMAIKASSLSLNVIGHDRDRSVLREATRADLIDEGEWRLVRAAAVADILVIALPSPEVEETLQAVGEDLQEHTLVLDLSAIKGPAQEWAEKHMERGHYVGAKAVLAAAALADGTPGLAGARADLFKNSVFCLMPSPTADPQAVETAVKLGTVLGAKPFFLDAAEYDSLVQGVEAAPGLLAAALFRAVTEATGWRDMLRFANLSFAQATQPLREGETIAMLALQDQPAMLRWLDAVLAQLQEMRQWVAEGDRVRMGAMLRQLEANRENWLHVRTENEWEESSEIDFKPLSVMEHFLGRRGGPEA